MVFGIVGRKETAVVGGRGDTHAVRIVHLHEDAVQLRAVLFAAVDAQRHMLSEAVEFADLDRRAERARVQVEPKPLVAVVGVGLEIADDE